LADILERSVFRAREQAGRVRCELPGFFRRRPHRRQKAND
jgi:hypothetical protein